jgi:hypothetical protein
MRFVHPYTWHRVKTLLYTKSKPNQSNSSGTSIPSLKFDLGIKKVVMKAVSSNIYWLNNTMIKLYIGGKTAKACTVLGKANLCHDQDNEGGKNWPSAQKVPVVAGNWEKKAQWCKRKMLVIVRQRWWEGESYPAFVVQSHGVESDSFVVRWQCRWKDKSDEEAKKKQRKGLTEQVMPCSHNRSLKSSRAASTDEPLRRRSFLARVWNNDLVA